MKNHTLCSSRPGLFLAFTRRKTPNSFGNMLLSSRLVPRFAPLSLLWETVFSLFFWGTQFTKILCFLVFCVLFLKASHWSWLCRLECSTRLIDKSFGRKLEPSGFTRNSTGHLEWFSIDSARRFRQSFHRLSKPWEHPRYVNNHCRGLSWISKCSLWRNSSQMPSIPELLLQG